MRALATLVFLAVLGWGAYWWTGATAQQKALELWLQDRRAADWVAETDSLKVIGFPNRFDTVIRNLELADPANNWAWSAPEFWILALAYKPNHIIVAFPGKQVVSGLNERVSIESELARASIVFKPETSLALDRLQLEARSSVFEGATGWRATAGEIAAAFFASQTVTDAPAYDLFVRFDDLTPARSWRRQVDPAGLLPDTIPLAKLDATLTYDKPWDRFAVEGRNPRLQTINVRELTFNWGTLELRGAGNLTIEASGFAKGKITLQARNWRKLLEVAQTSGSLAPDIAKNVEKALGLIAGISGNPESIEIPLTFKNGKAYIGPVSIGYAPYFGR